MRTLDELRLEDLVEMQQRPATGETLRAIGRSLPRAPSTIRRDCRRACVEHSRYEAQSAQQRSDRCRTQPHVTCELDRPALRETVQALLRARGSPKQIAGTLTRGSPDAASYRMSRKTIYSAVYLWCPEANCARS